MMTEEQVERIAANTINALDALALVLFIVVCIGIWIVVPA